MILNELSINRGSDYYKKLKIKVTDRSINCFCI